MGIEARNVTKAYGDFKALDDVSVAVRDGSLTALLGPSGGGKSTLLRVIAGLEEPDSGTVIIGDKEVTNHPPQRREVGFVFQHYAAFKHMTVADNVGFGLAVKKRPKDQIALRERARLARVGLRPRGRPPPPQRGGGQRQGGAPPRARGAGPGVRLREDP